MNYLKAAKRAFWNNIPDKYYLPLLYHAGSGAKKIIRKEISILMELVKARNVAVDIGANIGLYSYPLSKAFRKVVAFEPVPHCAAILKNYGAANIEVHNVGLSSFDGFLELHIPVHNGVEISGCASFSNIPGKDGKIITSPVTTLDRCLLTGVSLMKIDVEGHELEVLKGADVTIKREKPVILIEIEQRHLDFPMEIIFNRLRSYGYQGYFISGKALLPLSEFSLHIHQRQQDLNSGGAYVCNFIFKM